MSLWERLFLAAVFLIGGAVIVVALGATGIVRVPYVSEPEVEDDGARRAVVLLPPPLPDEDEAGLLAALDAAEDSEGLLEIDEGGEYREVDGSENGAVATDGGPSTGSSATASGSETAKAGAGRDPMVDRLKAAVDMTDPGQIMGFLIGTFTPNGTKLGAEDLEFLFEALGAQKDYGLRNLLFTHLQRIGGEEVTGGILEFLAGEKNPQSVARALGALKTQKDGDAVQGLVDYMAGTKNRKLRDVAFRSLLATGSGEATTSLLQLLNTTSDRSLKQYSLAALSQLGGERGTGAVLEFASSSDPYERTLGMKSLRDLKNPAAVPLLSEALNRGQGGAAMRQQVIRALGRMRDVRGVAPVSQIALYGETRMIRTEAIRSLATIGRAQGVPALQTIADTDQNATLRKYASRAIGAIRKAEERRSRRPPPRPRRQPRSGSGRE